MIRIPVLLIILSLFSNFFCQNNMEQIAYLEGEYDGERFGKYTAALDFNGDGFDELFIASPFWWDEQSDIGGRISIFWGGVLFDDEPDLFIYGDDLPSGIGLDIENLGDVNGDGKEDLGYSQLININDGIKFQILFGNQTGNIEPEYTFYFMEDEYRTNASINSIGDIDSDGYDDIGIAIQQANQTFNQNEYFIIYGSEEELNLELFLVAGDTNPPSSRGLNGVGDVNNDGFDDFCIGYKVTSEPEDINRNILYYGGSVIDTTNSVVIYEEEWLGRNIASAIGDINNDNYDDFIGQFYWGYVYLWLGKDEITSDYDILIENNLGGPFGDGVDFGDLNYDGYDDFVLGYPGYSLDYGKALLFMGSEEPNNTIDLEFEHVGILHRYGSSVSIGRFNYDLFEDVAISGPESDCNTHPGYVYIFAGNSVLEDYVSFEDNTLPENTFQAFLSPNPSVSNQLTLMIKNYSEPVTLKLYNIRGQLVYTQNISAGSTSIELNEPLPHGIYLYKIVERDTGRLLGSDKLMILN